jgi:acetyl esterase/lipase
MYADLTNLPPITITIGTKECSYSQIKTFVEKLKNYNDKVNFLVGANLFHVFPLFLFREGKECHDEICKIITTS